MNRHRLFTHNRMLPIERNEEKYMEKEVYMNELSRLLDEIRRFVKLNGDWTQEIMSGNDMSILKEIALSTQDIIGAVSEASISENDPNVKKILSSIGQFVSAIEASDPEKLKESSQVLKSIKTEYEQEKERAGKLQKVFKTDLQEMELHETKRNALQELVDMDLKVYGEVSATTLEVLDVQHYRLSSQNQVLDRDYPVRESEKEQAKQNEQEAEEQKQSFKAFAYMKNTAGKKQKPKVIYGNSPEDIITTLQGWNMGRTGAMKFCTCYISGLDKQTNAYVNPAKYDVATGIDITPIYLKIPSMDRNEFLKTVDQLKKDGAKYNPVEKKFYITRQNDLNKFSSFLPIVATQVNVSVEQHQDNYLNETDSMKKVSETDINSQPPNSAEMIEYNGKSYKPLQYNVLELALKQNFTREQMALLERPELSSDRMNEIRFAIKDGLSAEQIAMFATPEHEQWQMDLCRIGMQHGLKYAELWKIINPDNYSREQWGERRNQLAKIIKARERENGSLMSAPPQTASQKANGIKDSVISKISQNKAKLEADKNDADGQTRERKEALER